MYEESARTSERAQPGDVPVVLPQLCAGDLRRFMMVFALSIDDFVTSSFLFRDRRRSTTIPMLIYGTGRTGLNPSLNAVATVMLVLSLTAIMIAALVMRAIARHRGTPRPASPTSSCASSLSRVP